MRFIDSLRERQKTDIIQDVDLLQLFSDKSEKAIHSAISRCLKSKDLIRLKRGLYLFGAKYRKYAVVKFALAGQLYAPSYISFESALSFHQLIPETVYATTSACFLNKSKHYANEIGEFTFQYVPVQPFFLEVEQLKTPNSNALLAKPLRALFDMLYQRKVHYKTLDELEADLRLDMDELRLLIQEYQPAEMNELAALYKSQVVKKTNKLLLKSLL